MLRKTKIICTLGPATEDEAVLRRLMPLLPAFQLHGVAGDHVADGGGLLLRIL